MADIYSVMEKQTSSGRSAAETGTEVDDGRDTWLPSRRGILKLTGGGLGAMATGGTLLGSASAATTGGNCVQVDFVTGTSEIDDLSSAKYNDGNRLIEAQWAETVNNDTEGETTDPSASTDCTVRVDSSVSIDFSNNTASVTYTVTNCGGNNQDLMLVSYESPCNGAASTGGEWDSSNADQQSVFDTNKESGVGNVSNTITVDVPPLTAGAPQRSNAEAYFSLDQSSLPATDELDGEDTTYPYTNPTPGVNGQEGTAFDFDGDPDADGNGDAFNYPNQGITYDGTTDWTTSLWINPDSISGVTLWRPRAYDMWFNLYSDGYVKFGTYNGTDGVNTVPSGTKPGTNNWTHIAVVSDTSKSDQYQIYVDGAPDGSGNVPDPTTKGNENMIGGNTTNGKDWFNGQIDEVYVYSSALSDSEVNSLYTAAT
jgi:hypothetical protein